MRRTDNEIPTYYGQNLHPYPQQQSNQHFQQQPQQHFQHQHYLLATYIATASSAYAGGPNNGYQQQYGYQNEESSIRPRRGLPQPLTSTPRAAHYVNYDNPYQAYGIPVTPSKPNVPSHNYAFASYSAGPAPSPIFKDSNLKKRTSNQKGIGRIWNVRTGLLLLILLTVLSIGAITYWKSVGPEAQDSSSEIHIPLVRPPIPVGPISSTFVPAAPPTVQNTIVKEKGPRSGGIPVLPASGTPKYGAPGGEPIRRNIAPKIVYSFDDNDSDNEARVEPVQQEEL